MARPGWNRSKPFHNDEASDCDHDLPPWKEREITKLPWKARNPHERLEMIYWMIQQLEKQEVLDGTTPEKRATLRKRFHLARFLLPSELPQQKHRPDDVANSALNAAVDRRRDEAREIDHFQSRENVVVRHLPLSENSCTSEPRPRSPSIFQLAGRSSRADWSGRRGG